MTTTRRWAAHEVFEALPDLMAGKVTPTDPQHAHQHLREWADEMLAHCRMRVPGPPDEG